MLDAGELSEADMAEVVARSRKNARSNPNAQLSGEVSIEELMAQPMYVSPLRKHDCCPVSDGASAMVICTVEKAKALGKPYAVIKGIDHRIESMNLGARDLTRSVSTEQAAAAAGVADGPVEIAELHAPFSHQEIILKRALGLADDTRINLSGGVLAGNLMMAAGLDRIGEVAARISRGEAKRGVAHATSGACLQQNMVVVLEAE
jgi:acetyl-CoA acetyltransferase